MIEYGFREASTDAPLETLPRNRREVLAAAFAISAGAWSLDTGGILRPVAAHALGLVLAAAGGPGGLCLILFAAVSCALLTAGAVYELDAVGKGIEQRAAADPMRLPEAWGAALQGTDFAPLAASITGDELAIPPLALLRVLREEVWRMLVKRLVTSQTVTVLLGAAVLGFGADVLPIPVASPAQVLRMDAVAAGLFLALGVTGWLLLDRAIDRFGATMTRLRAAWEATIAQSSSAVPRRTEPSVAALVAQIESLSTAVDRLTALVGDSAKRQTEWIEELSRLMSVGVEAFARVRDRVEALPAEGEPAVARGLAQLAAAVEQLSQPVVEQMKLLDASDRWHVAMLQRQEELVASLAQRWSELVGTLQARAGLANIAAAAHGDADTRLLAPTTRESAGAPELEDELRELLDEMSDYEEPVRDPRLRS